MGKNHRITRRGSRRRARGKLVARLLVIPVAVASVFTFGPYPGSATGAAKLFLPSSVAAPRVPLHARASGPLPKAWTGEAIYPTSTTAIITAEINARDQRTRFKFQYGPIRPYAYTTQVGEREVVGHVTDGVSEALGHLISGTTYHFRIIAFNKYGFVVGKDRTFRTLKRNGHTAG